MFTRKFTRTATVTTAVTAAALALAVPQALATTSHSGTATYNCGLRVTEPSLHEHVISGIASSSCYGTGWQDQKLVVSVEEYILPWLIAVKAQATTGYSSKASLVQHVSFDCTATGTHVYTIEASWYGASGDVYAFRYPPKKITLTCLSHPPPHSSAGQRTPRRFRWPARTQG
ncbi:MAG TPA: hypothetical protein VKU39_10515 [Streptosporangiaceae bacterium]|nr:hypothetical protein [Streptosporangiaceae bacterium]